MAGIVKTARNTAAGRGRIGSQRGAGSDGIGSTCRPQGGLRGTRNRAADGQAAV
jgi:hypothetical protein